MPRPFALALILAGCGHLTAAAPPSAAPLCPEPEVVLIIAEPDLPDARVPPEIVKLPEAPTAPALKVAARLPPPAAAPPASPRGAGPFASMETPPAAPAEAARPPPPPPPRTLLDKLVLLLAVGALGAVLGWHVRRLVIHLAARKKHGRA